VSFLICPFCLCTTAPYYARLFCRPQGIIGGVSGLFCIKAPQLERRFQSHGRVFAPFLKLMPQSDNTAGIDCTDTQTLSVIVALGLCGEQTSGSVTETHFRGGNSPLSAFPNVAVQSCSPCPPTIQEQYH